jgi:hypothetical protein
MRRCTFGYRRKPLGTRSPHRPFAAEPESRKRLVEGVDREVRGVEGASGHAPAWIVLRNEPVHRKPTRHSEKRLHATRCWSLTVIHSRIVPIMRFRKRSSGAP